MNSEKVWHQDNPHQNNRQAKGLLGLGWRPLSRQFDLDFVLHLLQNDTSELFQKTLDFTSDVADTLGRNHYNIFANVLSLFSETMRYEWDEFWEYITPDPPTPNHCQRETIFVNTPITQTVTRDSIPIEYVLNRLQEVTLFDLRGGLGEL